MSTQRYRFGLFELDTPSNELRRDGTPVRLQAQPAQVLALLVRNAGAVVTREALREAVWGTDTFVDFDRNLNYCVTQIRSALGDSADSPRYIRTHPKKGYEFIAPVTSVNGRPEPRRWNARKLAFLGTALALVATGLMLGSRGLRDAAKPVTIAVVRFDNESTSPELTRFADGLTDMLVADLTQSGGSEYAVIGNAAALRMPRKERNLKKIGADLQVHYLIFGQVFSDSANHVRVLAHVIRMPDEKHLWVTRAEGELNGNDLVVQADFARRITADIRAKLPHRTR